MQTSFPYVVHPYLAQRLATREVGVGDVNIGGKHRIKIQTMTTTDTMDTEATVRQAIQCIEAGSDLIRITAPSKKEAENLHFIKKSLRAKGYKTPLVADIHYTPNAATIAAQIVEKVRINPGNYIDKKKFEFIEYSDTAYEEELYKIEEKFSHLLTLCKQHGTALRIGTNHGSLSDRIMSRYGDTPMGMVESAMEFLRIARRQGFHDIVLSMKASNTQIMTYACRLLVKTMQDEFGECYPLHLGVTEAGDGEDGRIKSAIGIGGLLRDGIGDTLRVSLTEDPEFELPVCREILASTALALHTDEVRPSSYDGFVADPFSYQRRLSQEMHHLGGKHSPAVWADLMDRDCIGYEELEKIGYTYDPQMDKWTASDCAADFLSLHKNALKTLPSLPPSLNIVVPADAWEDVQKRMPDNSVFPLFRLRHYSEKNKHPVLNFLDINLDEDVASSYEETLSALPKTDQTIALKIRANDETTYIQKVRSCCAFLRKNQWHLPVILHTTVESTTSKEQLLIHHSITNGGLLVDGIGDGICIDRKAKTSADIATLNEIAFGILQGARTRISKTEYISCPSCGRTLFDLQSTTQKIRVATEHLKGVKIAVMGCIVNGPGEMADADFGYVGSGVGKVSLYKGKEIVSPHMDSAVAVEALIALIKQSDMWKEKK